MIGRHGSNYRVFDVSGCYDGTDAPGFRAAARARTLGDPAAKLVMLRQDGSVAEAHLAAPQPGDEVLALRKIEAKRVEITRGITQIPYQIAVATKVLFGP